MTVDIENSDGEVEVEREVGFSGSTAQDTLERFVEPTYDIPYKNWVYEEREKRRAYEESKEMRKAKNFYPEYRDIPFAEFSVIWESGLNHLWNHPINEHVKVQKAVSESTGKHSLVNHIKPKLAPGCQPKKYQKQSQREGIILSALNTHGDLTATQILETTGLPKRSVSRDLSHLRKTLGLIKLIDGHYTLVQKEYVFLCGEENMSIHGFTVKFAKDKLLVGGIFPFPIEPEQYTINQYFKDKLPTLQVHKLFKDRTLSHTPNSTAIQVGCTNNGIPPNLIPAIWKLLERSIGPIEYITSFDAALDTPLGTLRLHYCYEFTLPGLKDTIRVYTHGSGKAVYERKEISKCSLKIDDPHQVRDVLIYLFNNDLAVRELFKTRDQLRRERQAKLDYRNKYHQAKAEAEALKSEYIRNSLKPC